MTMCTTPLKNMGSLEGMVVLVKIKGGGYIPRGKVSVSCRRSPFLISHGCHYYTTNVSQSNVRPSLIHDIHTGA